MNTRVGRAAERMYVGRHMSAVPRRTSALTEPPHSSKEGAATAGFPREFDAPRAARGGGKDDKGDDGGSEGEEEEDDNTADGSG
mmetsp:Transcript_49114/g.98838  ORF Transcript_49114/g.98838 Transcript_49114/m.98838 type:complete len:84 (+) Transcript_49114:309-560(+)